MTTPSRMLGRGRVGVVSPRPNRPEDRIAYWKELGIADPLCCATCGKFNSELAAPEWRCTCLPVPAWALAAAREIVDVVNLDGSRHLNDKAVQDFAKIIAGFAAKAAP